MRTKFQRLLFAGLILSLGAGCTTAYDAYGRPRQVVEPEAAILGAAAVGLLGYSLANRHNYNRPSYHNQPNYYRRPHPGPYGGPPHHPSYRGGPYHHH
jgi:hypothetical protein